MEEGEPRCEKKRGEEEEEEEENSGSFFLPILPHSPLPSVLVFSFPWML